MSNIPNKPNKPNQPKSGNNQPVSPKKNITTANSTTNNSQSAKTNQDIVKQIKDTIQSDECKSLKDYPIKTLIKQAEDFGYYLKTQKLETNQIRKFLDAINQFKSRLAQEDDDTIKQAKTEVEKDKLRFARIGDELVFLKVKLTWSAARQKAAIPFKEVMSVAIDKVYSTKDFERLVQFIESIIAYHKEAEQKKYRG
ncbi:MAG: type III-A CRISPR-associated protein Csm2 [Rivularia sp. (in: cyanobacteria)]